MTNQALSTEHLSGLAAASLVAVPASKLVDILAQQEPEIVLLFTDRSISGDVDFLSSFYASYLIALLLVDDLNEARFLIQRFPPTLADTNQVLVNTKRLLRAVWSREYTLIYQVLEEHQWPDVLKPLIGRYLEYLQSTTFRLLSRAYTAATPGTASMYLGSPFGAEQVTRNGEISNDKVMIEQLLQRGWSYDAEQMLLHPALIGEDEGQPSRLHAGDVRGLRGMDSLVGLVGFLGE